MRMPDWLPADSGQDGDFRAGAGHDGRNADLAGRLARLPDGHPSAEFDADDPWDEADDPWDEADDPWDEADDPWDEADDGADYLDLGQDGDRDHSAEDHDEAGEPAASARRPQRSGEHGPGGHPPWSGLGGPMRPRSPYRPWFAADGIGDPWFAAGLFG
jgi:hypothetical protein